MKPFETPQLHQRFLYWISSGACRVISRLLWRAEVSGLENVPSQGGVLIAPNHISLADPPLVGCFVSRPIHFFAKEELFRVPLFGWYIRQLNAFPVKRFEHDVGAFKKAQTLLKQGEGVLVFPEGRRSKTGDLGKAKAGVGMLAYKAQVPAVPVCVENSNCLKHFKKIRIVYGQPVYPKKNLESKEDYQNFSDAVVHAIAELKRKMYNDTQNRM